MEGTTIFMQHVVLAIVTRQHWKPNTQTHASFQRLAVFKIEAQAMHNSF